MQKPHLNMPQSTFTCVQHPARIKKQSHIFFFFSRMSARTKGLRVMSESRKLFSAQQHLLSHTGLMINKYASRVSLSRSLSLSHTQTHKHTCHAVVTSLYVYSSYIHPSSPPNHYRRQVKTQAGERMSVCVYV